MRVLFSFVGGTGHAEPMVPVATALRAAGHTVAFAGHADPLRGLDFDTVVTAGTVDGPPPERLPLAEPSQEHEEEVVQTYFADRGPRARLDRYREAYPDWRPDLVVRDEMDLAGARPRVYVTLGTVFPLESGDLLPRLLAGLAALPVDVVATTGRDVDPAELGPQPPNVRIERWLALPELLPTVDLVVSHGGSGTVGAAAARGIPQVVVAMGADQLLNARRVTALGLGRALHPTTLTPDLAADAVAAVLADPAAHAAAARLAAEYAALPDPASTVPALESLARHA